MSRADWTEKLAFARESGLLSATWHPDGSLASFTLDPALQPEAALTEEERAARKQASADAHRRVLTGATARLRQVGSVP